MGHPSIITCCLSSEERGRTIPLENVCSRIPAHRSDGAFPSLVELRRVVHADIAVTVAHIRLLIMLEDMR